MAGRVGFEPTTSSLEGWLAIRAATSAQQLERKMDVQVLRFPIGLTREEEIFLKVIRTAPRILSELFNGNSSRYNFIYRFSNSYSNLKALLKTKHCFIPKFNLFNR